MKNKDNLHFSWSKNLSYHKQWNIVIGQRESGKSVDSWLLIWKKWHYNNQPSIILRRRPVDITAIYIEDLQNLLNKFLEKPIQLVFIKSQMDDGIVDVKVGELGVQYSWQMTKQLPVFIRIIALSLPMARLKSYMLPDLAFMFMDEFIVNLYLGEKYLENEPFRIKELYTTYNREAKKPIRILAAGNPYSTFTPIFEDLGVPTDKLKPGAFLVGPNYTVNVYKVSDELLNRIFEANPMYRFDDEYKKYAFEGQNINDANINICKCEPCGYKMKYVFKTDGGKYLSIHRRGPRSDPNAPMWWLCTHDRDWYRTLSKRRNIIVFSFADLSNDGQARILTTTEINCLFMDFNESMRKGDVWCNGISAYYYAQDVTGLTTLVKTKKR